MAETLRAGIKGGAAVKVCAENTALAMGSGELEVFATPALAALVEKAAVKAVAGCLGADETTVGTRIVIDHVSATPVGMEVRCEAELVALEGRKLVFRAEVFDTAGLVGRAEHERAIVARERFIKKAAAKGRE